MQQRGFTLLELMLAMAIFAVLAVAGWQVFDSVNRARERAQFHADQLAVLQYAYLQIQQDMAQMVPYHSLTAQESSGNTLNNNASNGVPNTSADPNVAPIIPEPFMRLDGEQLSFIRFADPDPRYKTSPSLQRIAYIVSDEQLIRRQYVNPYGGMDGISLDSVLLTGISGARWQAFLPEISATFPNKERNNQNNNSTAQTEGKLPMLLPNGIAVGFTYQELPITWRWSLAVQTIPVSQPADSEKNAETNNPNGNANSNPNNNNANNGSNGNLSGNADTENGLPSNNTAAP